MTEEQRLRQFRSKAMPDYEQLKISIMPSDKPSTVPVKPTFASDKLPKREPKLPSPKKSDSPKDFVF